MRQLGPPPARGEAVVFLAVLSSAPMEMIPHGGRLLAARRRHPDAPAPFLDLSTGINPNAYPFTPPPPDAWRRLPEPESLRALEVAAARAYGVRDAAMVVAAPGTQALIQLLPRVLPTPHVTVVGLTYAEHAASWAASGSVVTCSDHPAGPAAVLCNPNNPDGARHDPGALAAVSAGLALLVVDEAFVDFVPGLSLAPFLPLPRVVVLRSFGKAYGLAGLRLGFALAEPGLAERLRTALGPWPVGGPALDIGTQALRDTAWQHAAARTATAAAARLDGVLTTGGLDVLGGTPLFRLAETPDAAGLAERLARAGILVRSFEGQPGWVRFGLPADDDAFARLAAALP